MKASWPASAAHVSPRTVVLLIRIAPSVYSVQYTVHGAQAATVERADPDRCARAGGAPWPGGPEHAQAGPRARRVADERLPLLPRQGRAGGRRGRSSAEAF